MNTPHKPDTKTLILARAVPLFARHGFTGVTMRDIAEAVGVRAPALYNHFRDKQSLYLAVVSHAFSGKAAELSAVLRSAAPPRQRLESYIRSLYRLLAEDPDLYRLIQREILDGDEQRLRLLVGEVLGVQFQALMRLAEELAPAWDPHLLAVSIVGLVSKHMELRPLRRLLPGHRPEHDAPEVVARHVARLVLHGLDGPP